MLSASSSDSNHEVDHQTVERRVVCDITIGESSSEESLLLDELSKIKQKQSNNIYQFRLLTPSSIIKKKISKKESEDTTGRRKRLRTEKKKQDSLDEISEEEQPRPVQFSSQNPLDQLLVTVKEQLKGNTYKTRNDYRTIGLYQTIKFNEAEHLFGDVHLEFTLNFIDTYFNSNKQSNSSSMETISYEAQPEQRFTKFQFWRPCMYSEHVKEDKLVKYQILPNVYNRTTDYSRFKELYSRSSNSMVKQWSANIELFQKITEGMKIQMKMFSRDITSAQQMLNNFNHFKEQFHLQSQREIKKLKDKSAFFVYYFGGINLETHDFQIDHFGVSEEFIDLLGTKREDTAQCLMKYGLPFFMTQLTRISRYMNDFQFLLNGIRAQENQDFITLDDYHLESVMTPTIYEMEFTEEQLKSMSPEMVMLMRIVMHFRVDVYTFSPNTIKQLQAKRENDLTNGVIVNPDYHFYCNDAIFKNELIEKFYSKEQKKQSSK